MWNVWDLVRAVAGRVVAAGVAAGAGYVAAKTGAVIDPDCQAQVAQVVVGGVMLAAYGITHTALPQADPAKKNKP